MAEAARLALEALNKLRILRHFLRKKLYGDPAAELRVFGLVNNAHSAAA
jgi:hypothetical protein